MKEDNLFKEHYNGLSTILWDLKNINVYVDDTDNALNLLCSKPTSFKILVVHD